MSIFKNIVGDILPPRLRELIHLLLQWHAMAKNNAKIAEKNRRKIDALMESNNPVKLELGADQNRGIVGWTYVDMNGQCDLTLDLLQPLPFPDNCVEMIYSSHLLEHFRYPDLINLLNECLRILKPGGIFSAAIPNARLYLEAYHNPADFDPSLFCRYEPAYHYHSKIDYVNYMAYMDGHHHYMFDEDNIDAILRKTGFKTVRPREFDKNLDMEVRNFQTIYVHCEK